MEKVEPRCGGVALGVTAMAGRLRGGCVVRVEVRSARKVTPAFGPLLNSEQKLTYTRFQSCVEKNGPVSIHLSGSHHDEGKKIVAIAANGTAARRSRRLLSAQLVHGGIAAFFESSADPL